MSEIESRPTVVATRIRIAENELDQIKPGTKLYKEAVDALEEARQGWMYVQSAKEIYTTDGEIEIDDDAGVSISEAGAYVQGWLWVQDEDEEDNA